MILATALAAGEAGIEAIEWDLAALQAQQTQAQARLQPLPGPSRAQIVDLVFPALVGWSNRLGEPQRSDLSVRLRLGGALLVEPAESPHWKPGQRFPVEASGLQADAAGMRGTIVVRLPRPGSITITVDGVFKAGTLAGTWSTSGYGAPPIAASQGTFAAKLVEVVVAPEPTAQKEALDMMTEHTQAERLAWLDRATDHAYQRIRAFTIARTAKIPWEHAAAFCPLDELVYSPAKAGPAGHAGESDPEGRDSTSSTLLAMVRDRAAARLRAVTAYQAALARSEGEPGLPASPTVEDPDFGPWFGEVALPAKDSRINILPADVGRAGVQHWPWISRWTCYGPYRQRQRHFLTPLLPEFQPSPGCRLSWGAYLPGNKDLVEGMPGPGTMEPGTGRVRPSLVTANIKGFPKDAPQSTIYATTTVEAASDQPLWLGITVNDHGQLWINDRLVWVSPPPDQIDRRERTSLVQVRLVPGTNRLLMRCDNDQDQSWFSVRVCVQGQPRSAAVAQAARTAVAAQLDRAGHPGQGLVGWRQDGSGVVPDARPPLAWDLRNGINQIWRKPLSFGFSTPLVVGDAVFTLEEPHTLICFAAADGAERWRRELDLLDLRDEALRAEGVPLRTSAAAARAELARIGGDAKGERQQKLVAQGLSVEAAKAKLDGLNQVVNAYQKFLSDRCNEPKLGWRGDIGNTYPTPVSDGTHIWVKTLLGALACVDLAGNVRWMVDHASVAKDVGSLSSPLLVDGKILVFGPPKVVKSEKSTAKKGKDDAVDEDVPPPAPSGPRSGSNQLCAFDSKTGAVVWTTRLWSYSSAYWTESSVPGTPIPLRLSNGTDTMDVVVTASGAVVRVADGKQLCTYLGLHEIYGSPISDRRNRVVIANNGAKAAYELVMLDRDTVGGRLLWHIESPNVFQDGNYGLLHGGKLLYSRPELDCTDLASGAMEWLSGNIFFCQPGRGYVPPLLAGGHLYAGDNGSWFQPTYRTGFLNPSALSVVLPGNPVLVLARNQVEVIHGGFAAAGDRLFIRSRQSLTCLGHTGDPGRTYEAAVVLRELDCGRILDRPQDGPVVKPATTVDLGKERPSASNRPDGLLLQWILAGPIAESEATAVAGLLTDPTWPGWNVKTTLALSHDGKPVPLRRLHAENMPEWAADDPFRLRERPGFKHGPHTGFTSMLGDFVDLTWIFQRPGSPAKGDAEATVPGAAVPGAAAAAGQVVLLAYMVDNDRKRLLRFDATHARVGRAWIGGTPIRHNQLVELPAGRIPLVAAVTLDQPTNPLLVRPRLRLSTGHDQDLAQWKDLIARIRPYLDRAAALPADHPAGVRARAILDQAR